MKTKASILGVCGSIRSNFKSIMQLIDMVENAGDQSDLAARIEESGKIFSNTDVAVAFALLGAKEDGSDIDIISVTDIFEKKNMGLYEYLEKYERTCDIEDIDTLSINEKKLNIVLEKIKAADGIVLGSPVYFGDRSSVANKLLQITNKSKLLKNKAFGMVSVGAKRNGGQETTNIYGLTEALMQGSIIVGNGSPNAQYGGTVVAGDLGHAVKDSYGMETSYGTGRQVSRLSKILKIGKEPTGKKSLNINVLITMDTPSKKYEGLVSKYFEVNSYGNKINIINLIDRTIYRCVACNICPSPELMEKHRGAEVPYNCIVQSRFDALRELYEILRHSDCIVIVGVNSQSDLIYRYQVFLERTRFIRRENFAFTHIPTVGFLINELGSINSPLHNIRVITSFIRHNAFLLKPIELVIHNDNIMIVDDFAEHARLLQRISRGRKNAESFKESYKAIGYSNKKLDFTIAERK